MGKRNATASGFTRLLPRMLIGAVVGAALLTVIMWVIPRTYTSSAVLLFPGAKSGGSGLGDPMGAALGSGGGSADQPSLPLMQGVLSVPQPGTSPSTAALILRSRRVTTDLIERFGLDKEWRLPMERAIERFHQVFVCYEGKSGDLRVVYTDRTPQRAQETIAAALEMLTHSVEDLSLNTAARNVAVLEKSVKEAEAVSNTLQDEIVRLQRSVGGTPPDAQVQALGQLLADLQKELAAAEVDATVAVSSKTAATDVAKKMIQAAQDPAGSGNALINTLYRDVTQRESELALLREKYTDRRPEVVQARQAVEAARRALEREVERQAGNIEQGASPLVKDSLIAVMTAQARVDGLRQSTKQVRQRLDSLPAAQARYSQLQADLRDQRSRVTLLRSEYLRAQLIAERRGPQFVMLDPPTLPKRPDGYEMYAFALIGAGVGALCVLLGAFAAWIKRSTRNMPI